MENWNDLFIRYGYNWESNWRYSRRQIRDSCWRWRSRERRRFYHCCWENYLGGICAEHMNTDNLAGLFFQQSQCVVQTVIDVGLDGGKGSGSAQQSLTFGINGGHLGIGAAEVDQQYGAHYLNPRLSGLPSEQR